MRGLVLHYAAHWQESLHLLESFFNDALQLQSALQRRENRFEEDLFATQ